MTTNRTLWESDGGTVCCPNHIGISAKCELEANPKARTLYTGPDTWHKMSKADATDWATYLAEQGYSEPCEYCRQEQGSAY